ncbi:MAG TPA: YXWGXW repeat-containing protein [Vicinamibacterales bacterium]|nr:YXWGXW repeat-containing protein [Vicinamibacterales bacterium]
MRNLRKTLLIAAFCCLTASAASAQISFGVTIGPPPPPRAVVVAPMPGPDHVWVDGYWYPVGQRWMWHAGYWTRPPYAGAYWVQPYHDGARFVPGYWEGDRGRLEHDHRWDRGRDRDADRHDRDRRDHDRR